MTDWETQYAIRMPDGSLYSTAGPVATERDYSVDSASHDMFSGLGALFGMTGPTVSQPVGAPVPMLFPNEQAAQRKLEELRKHAAGMGVTLWGGEIVHRVCTPFTTGSAARQFMTALQSWMQQQQDGVE